MAWAATPGCTQPEQAMASDLSGESRPFVIGQELAIQCPRKASPLAPSAIAGWKVSSLTAASPMPTCAPFSNACRWLPPPPPKPCRLGTAPPRFKPSALPWIGWGLWGGYEIQVRSGDCNQQLFRGLLLDELKLLPTLAKECTAASWRRKTSAVRSTPKTQARARVPALHQLPCQPEGKPACTYRPRKKTASKNRRLPRLT